MSTPSTQLSGLTVNEQKFEANFAGSVINHDSKISVLLKVANRDKSALEECVERYGNAVWMIAKKFADSPEEAEKLTCRIFSDLWKNVEDFDCNKYADDHFMMLIILKCIRKYKKNLI